MSSSIRYLSGRDQFIGLGIAWPTDDPNWKLPLDPAQYPGAIAWAQDQLHYWSDGSRWIPLLNLPIDTPYIVPPSNEYEKRCITVTPFRSTLNIEHTGTVFQAYDTPLIEGVDPILEIRLTKDGSWLVDELNSRRYVLDENISGNATISVELPNKTYGDIIYLRAQYIGEGANSRWSPLYGQTLPKRIDKPKIDLPNLGTTDQFLLNPIPSNVDRIIGYNDYWNFAGAVYEIYTDPGLTNLVESGQINPSDTVEFANLLAGEITYNGSSLEDGTLYFYRIKYLANSSFYGSWEGDWSETRSFYPVSNSIVLDIDTTLSVGTTFRLLLGSRDTNISGSVNWGDGNITSFSGFTGDLEVSNAYASEGQYTVVIKLDLAARGMLSHIGGTSFSQNNQSSQAKITAVRALGEDMGLSSLNYAFQNCINLTSLPDVLPKYNGGANGITSLFNTFRNCISLGKPNIARWDVSTVNTFESCFNGCISFNADIGNWDMSSATNLRSMFSGCINFNAAIENWGNTLSQVSEIDYCFNGCRTFNRNVNSWGPGLTGCQSYASVFQNCEEFNRPLDLWFSAGHSVISIDSMLYGAINYNQNIGIWFTDNLTRTYKAFRDCNKLNFDASSWALSNLVTAEEMFMGCSALTGTAAAGPSTGFDGLVLSNLRFGARMFRGTLINPDVGGWFPAPSALEDAKGMFEYNSQFVGTNIDQWDTSSIEDMSYMFRDCRAFVGANIGQTWDTSNVGAVNANSGMSFMFQNTLINEEFDLWDYSNVNTIEGMFLGCKQLGTSVDNKTRYILDSSNPNKATKVITLENLYRSCDNFNEDLTSWDVSSITNMGFMFSKCFKFNNGDPRGTNTKPLTGWDVSNVTDFKYMFQDAAAFNQDITNWDVSNGVGFQLMFDFLGIGDGVGIEEEFNQDLSSWRLDNAINVASMFRHAGKVDFDLSNWFVNKNIDPGLPRLTYIHSMFRWAYSFTGGAGMGTWDVSNVESFAYMFNFAKAFNVDISDWDVSSGKSFDRMFSGAHAFNFGLGAGVAQAPGEGIDKWDMSSAEDLSYMFNECLNFNQNLDTVASTWSNVKYMLGMLRIGRNWNNGNAPQVITAPPTPISWNLPELLNTEYLFSNADNMPDDHKFSGVVEIVAPKLESAANMFYNNRWYSEQDTLAVDLKNWFSSGRAWRNSLINLTNLFNGNNTNTIGNISSNILAEIYQTWAANAFNSITGTREYPLGVFIHLGASQFDNDVILSTGWSGTTLEAKELLTKDPALGGLGWTITDGGAV